MLARTALRAGDGRLFQASLRAGAGRGRRHQRSLSSFKNGAHYQIPRDTGLLLSKGRARVPQNRPTIHRTFLTESVPPFLVPPVVFVGLLLTLWAYKCMMMVLFQNKIIYMPNIPPFARSEKIEDYAAQCKPMEWEETRIRSLDGTKIALCIGRMRQEDGTAEVVIPNNRKGVKEVVICYFQGNGASLPPRLPILSSVLKFVQAGMTKRKDSIQFTLIALSYRGYWTSSGRASQSGIELDAQALLKYVRSNFSTTNDDVELILWGQSIGCGVATTAAAFYLSEPDASKPTITGLVLETPFTSVKNMLIALYPQKWLPYRYLSPFLWNHWDSAAALHRIAMAERKPRVLLLPSSRDEVVPSDEAEKLEAICSDLKFEYERSDVLGALHNEATVRRNGQQAVAKFISHVAGR